MEFFTRFCAVDSEVDDFIKTCSRLGKYNVKIAGYSSGDHGLWITVARWIPVTPAAGMGVGTAVRTTIDAMPEEPSISLDEEAL